MRGVPQITGRNDFDLEELIPLTLIREHSKTDDTPLVTDPQIELYRKTAVEQAELYTGRFISGNVNIQETVYADGERMRARRRSSFRVKLSYLPMDAFIVLSDANSNSRQNVPVRRNSRKLDITPDFTTFAPFDCCNRNSRHGLLEEEYNVTYRSGYAKTVDVPSTIIYGCLKFLMWAIANPGDELLTVRNRLGTTETGLIGTNNGAWASGAIEHWMGYKVD